MSEKIIFVDDEPHVLASMKRQLRRRFNITTAESGVEALEKFKTEGPFSVIVSDMRMPSMDGIELLSSVKDLYPDTVRLMLTGNADQETAMEAVNKGHIFRFLTKPCPASLLITSLVLALKQYKLITAEKQLLDETLKGSVKVLSELLNFSNPAISSSGIRIQSIVVKIAKQMGHKNLWKLEIAALMSQIGCITLPREITNKVYSNTPLDPEEIELYKSHPEAGAKLLESVPRLEDVVYIIKNQQKTFSEFDPSDKKNLENNLGAQIIKAVYDYDIYLLKGLSHNDVIRHLRKNTDEYNPSVLRELGKIKPTEIKSTSRLMVQDLAVGMIVDANIKSTKGTLLVAKGAEITKTVLVGLQNYAKQNGVQEPVVVKVADDDTMEDP